jgi:hypothetical protein
MKNLIRSIFAGVLAIALILAVSVIPSSVSASFGNKALVDSVIVTNYSGSKMTIEAGFYDSTHVFDNAQLNITFSTAPDFKTMKSEANAAILSYSSDNGYGLTADDIIWPYTTIRQFNNTPSHSIVTGTGATGFQVSSDSDSFVSYSTKIVTTATISGSQDGYIVLEIAPTNSATAGDWKEIGRVENGQSLSLALTLQSVQTTGGTLTGIVPAGWYAKLRSVNVSGTPTYSYVSGQEVQE